MQVDIMVTAGANQAFVNVLLTLTDATDTIVLFKPYYFNHLMACQMTGSARTVLLGEPQANMKPDLQWLQQQLQSEKPPKMVTIVNPCNPAGACTGCLRSADSAQCVCWYSLACTRCSALRGWGVEDHCMLSPQLCASP